MGMFDREPNFEEVFSEGERFVLLDAEYVGEINTREGMAQKVIFTIVARSHPDIKRRYSALGKGFANQAKRAERGDFPVVVEYTRVPTGQGGNKVKLLAPVPDVSAREFIDGNDGPPLPEQDLLTPTAAAPTEEEIGF